MKFWEKKFFSLDLDHTKTAENWAMQRFDFLSLPKIIISTTEFPKWGPPLLSDLTGKSDRYIGVAVTFCVAVTIR